MQNIKILTDALWLRSKRTLSGEENETKANIFSTLGWKKYAGSSSDAWCVNFKLASVLSAPSWITLDKLLVAIKNADIHLLNPEILVGLIKKSRIQKKTKWIDDLTFAIQMGDYKEMFDQNRKAPV